jgi:hypothetical protein
MFDFDRIAGPKLGTIFVREFSAAGPCIVLGELTSLTASTVVFRKRDGSTGKRGGYRLKAGLIHTKPCRSCCDHAKSQYPRGYED